MVGKKRWVGVTIPFIVFYLIDQLIIGVGQVIDEIIEQFAKNTDLDDQAMDELIRKQFSHLPQLAIDALIISGNLLRAAEKDVKLYGGDTKMGAPDENAGVNVPPASVATAPLLNS